MMADSSSLDPRRFQALVHIRHVSAVYDERTLARILAKKIVQRFRSADVSLAPIVAYDGLVVFDSPDLDGGGLEYGTDFARLLLTLGMTGASRLFEFCAGPGYIGFFLLSLGFCQELIMADINPAAVAAARRTVAVNELSERVRVFQSDGLAKIPTSEKWDVVVGNPPHFLSADPSSQRRAVDPQWTIHAGFYKDIGKFMEPGGRVILVENDEGSTVDVFEPMITAGGGRLEHVLPARDGLGRPKHSYFVVSSW